MSTEASLKLVRKALDHATEHSAAHFNSALYSRVLSTAEGIDTESTAAFAETRAEFAAEGVVQRVIDLGRIKTLLRDRPFSKDVGNRHSRLTSCGNGRTPFNPMMRTLVPDEALI